MPTGFLESEAGQKEYARLEIPYPKTIQDELYDKWLSDTSAEELSKYSRKKEKEINRISRLRTGDGHEYILYSYIHYRLDRDLNLAHRYRPNVGTYPIPQALYSTEFKDFGKQVRKLREIVSLDTGYWIPFTPKRLDEIKNMGTLSDKISYSVFTDNGLHVSVASYDDLRNGDYDELLHFGKIPNETQRRVWIEKEGGPNADKQQHTDVKYQRDDRSAGVQERAPTMNEIREMIAAETEAAKAAKATEKEETSKPKQRKR